MKSQAFFPLLALAVAGVAAQVPPADTASAFNPLVDPFAARAKPVLPPPPPPSPSSSPVKRSAAARSLRATALPPAPSLPAGLRVMLIRDQGLGLLGLADAGAVPISVSNGKKVRIGSFDYHAVVSATQISLYSSAKGKLIWEGTLGDPVLVSTPMDLSQARYVPPLSAGVSPGLKSAASSAKADTAEQPN